MHASSITTMAQFIETYVDPFRGEPLVIADLGSQLVTEGNLTYQTMFDDPAWSYTGLDVAAGLNVDVVLDDPYRWDGLAEDSFDIVVSGQALEHIKYFWLTAIETARVLKPGGITMFIAPSAGYEHRWPVDCWRFYRDGMEALAEYVGLEVLDVHTSWEALPWADSSLVMRKPLWGNEERASFARRRDAHFEAFRGESPATPTATAPTADPSPFASVEGGRLAPKLAEIFTAPAPQSVAPAPEVETSVIPEPVAEEPLQTDDAALGGRWRHSVRRVLGARGLAVYRAARYGNSHPAPR